MRQRQPSFSVAARCRKAVDEHEFVGVASQVVLGQAGPDKLATTRKAVQVVKEDREVPFHLSRPCFVGCPTSKWW